MPSRTRHEAGAQASAVSANTQRNGRQGGDGECRRGWERASERAARVGLGWV